MVSTWFCMNDILFLKKLLCRDEKQVVNNKKLKRIQNYTFVAISSIKYYLIFHKNIRTISKDSLGSLQRILLNYPYFHIL